MDVLLSIENLSKSFGKKNVLNSINLSVKRKEIVGLVGKSGCGKSVLVKTLIGFYKQTSGKIIFNSQLKNKIGFSMQNNSIYDNLTLIQNLDYFSKIYGIARKIRKERIRFLVKQLNLEGYEKKLVINLSGGTKKRVDIACALLNDPQLLVLDEPFLGLDPALVSTLSNLILSLNKEGKTIIISSHRTKELSDICTRLIFLKDGKIFALKKSQLAGVYS